LRERRITVDETFGAVALAELVRHRYDVVHAYTPTAALAGRLSGHRTIFTVLGHPTPEALAGRAVYRRMFVAAARAATMTVALSRASADASEELLGGNVEVLSPGVRLAQFPARPEPAYGPPRILFSAFAADRRKCVDVALAALVELLATRHDARLLLSGAGDFRWARERLGDRAETAMAATDDLGAGSLDDVPARYRDSTVTVLPSRDEAFGLALVESLASGTPVVCSDSGGMAEIVCDPMVGRVFPVGDASQLARCLDETIELAADWATAARCSAHARRWGWLEAIGPDHEQLLGAVARR
jgi:glycosyltransferase involved in cell wall biosynthesis